MEDVQLPEPVNLHIQQQQPGKTLSEVDKADLDKVFDVVENMKSMATGIGQEMDRQLDRFSTCAFIQPKNKPNVFRTIMGFNIICKLA